MSGLSNSQWGAANRGRATLSSAQQRSAARRETIFEPANVKAAYSNSLLPFVSGPPSNKCQFPMWSDELDCPKTKFCGRRATHRPYCKKHFALTHNKGATKRIDAMSSPTTGPPPITWALR